MSLDIRRDYFVLLPQPPSPTFFEVVMTELKKYCLNEPWDRKLMDPP